MNRLTEKDDQGNWALKGIHWQQLYVGQVITRKVQEKLYGALHKLLDYEEVGLSPDEVESLKDKNRWIPVSEGMPEERNSTFAKFKGTEKWTPRMFEKISRNVLVTIAYDDGTRMTRQAHTVDGKWKIELSVLGGMVIAWKPFPEPYKEKNNE